MVWRFLKSVPKYLLVLVVLVGSTGLFIFWRMFLSPEKRAQAEAKQEEIRQEKRESAEVAREHAERLILIDNKLYDSETGELLFFNWLKDEMPQKLFIEPERTSVLAQYENGFVRYGFDGAKLASLTLPHGFPVDDTYRWALYCKDGDIWRADVDWKSLKFTNERKVTSTGQFQEKFFGRSFLFGTEETLVLTVMNQQLLVNLASGEVKQVRYPLDNLVKRRSPDSKFLVGVERGQFYCHEVDKDETKTLALGRAPISDYQWAGNDKCFLLVGGTSIAVYDRVRHSLSEICSLPGQCVRIGELSPDGRFLFCQSRNGLALVDTEKKKLETSFAGEGIFWLDPVSFIFSRDVPDSAQRGVWIYKVGSVPKRILDQPYRVARSGDSVLRLASGSVVFVSGTSVMRFNPGDSSTKEVLKNAGSKADRLLELSKWPPSS